MRTDWELVSFIWALALVTVLCILIISRCVVDVESLSKQANSEIQK